MSGPAGRVAASGGTLGRTGTWETPRSGAAEPVSLIPLTGSLCNFQRQLFAGASGRSWLCAADPAQALLLALAVFCGVPQRLFSALLSCTSLVLFKVWNQTESPRLIRNADPPDQ